MEELVISIDQVPEKVYHIVPVNFFEKYSEQWIYDPRNRDDFGKNSPFIHTTPSIQQMQNHLWYLQELVDHEFYLLEIDTKKLHNPKVTYIQSQDRIYHHLWCALPIDSYTKYLVKKEDLDSMKKIF